MPFWQSQEFWLSALIIAGGAGAIVAVFAFGNSLSKKELEHWFHQYWVAWFGDKTDHYRRKEALQEVSDIYRSYLRERNDFWDKYGQVIVAIVIIVVLAVLLLTKTSSPEAGLPILSAVGGFAIAKTSSISNSSRPRGGPEGE